MPVLHWQMLIYQLSAIPVFNQRNTWTKYFVRLHGFFYLWDTILSLRLQLLDERKRLLLKSFKKPWMRWDAGEFLLHDTVKHLWLSNPNFLFDFSWVMQKVICKRRKSYWKKVRDQKCWKEMRLVTRLKNFMVKGSRKGTGGEWGGNWKRRMWPWKERGNGEGNKEEQRRMERRLGRGIRMG